MTANRWALRSPSHFDFMTPDGKPCRGADQEWYRDAWQRKAGCGPTTAATCLSYLARQNPPLSRLLPPSGSQAGDFVAYMEAVWKKVTPTVMGLNSLALYWNGALAFAAEQNCRLSYEALEIPGKSKCGRPSLSEIAAFLQKALGDDRPVAFLNFSNGALENLESWHWVPLIWAEEREDTILCGILDEGAEKTVDLGLWHRTSLRGGGFVALWADTNEP